MLDAERLAYAVTAACAALAGVIGQHLHINVWSKALIVLLVAADVGKPTGLDEARSAPARSATECASRPGRWADIQAPEPPKTAEMVGSIVGGPYLVVCSLR